MDRLPTGHLDNQQNKCLFHKRFASPLFKLNIVLDFARIKEPFGGHHTRGNNDSKLLRVEHPERTLMKNRLMERE